MNKKLLLLLAVAGSIERIQTGQIVNWLVSDPKQGYKNAREKLTTEIKKKIGEKYQDRKKILNMSEDTFTRQEFLDRYKISLTDTEQEAINKGTISIMHEGNNKYPQRSLEILGITAAIGVGAALLFEEYQRRQREEEEKQKNQNNTRQESSSRSHSTTNNFHYHAAPNIHIGNTTEAVLNLTSSPLLSSVSQPSRRFSGDSYGRSEPSAKPENIHLSLGCYENQLNPTVVSLPHSTFESLQTTFTDSHKVPHVVIAGVVGVGVYRYARNIWIALGSMLTTQIGLNFWAHQRNVSFLEKMKTLGNVLPAYTPVETPPAYTPNAYTSCSTNQINNQVRQANEALANYSTNRSNSSSASTPPSYVSIYPDLPTLPSYEDATKTKIPHIVFSTSPSSTLTPPSYEDTTTTQIPHIVLSTPPSDEPSAPFIDE